MSLPGIAVLYGGLVQRKWVVNTMLMAFAGFSLVLLVWVLWGYNMGFGPRRTSGQRVVLVRPRRPPHPIVSHFGEQKPGGLGCKYPDPVPLPDVDARDFQFVFAAITPLLFLGSVLGRMKFKAWLLFVPCGSPRLHVNAALPGAAGSSPKGRGRLLVAT